MFVKKTIVLSTKDMSSETTIRNLNGLFPYIHDSLQLKAFFAISYSINRLYSIFMAEDSILRILSHPVWVPLYVTLSNASVCCSIQPTRACPDSWYAIIFFS